MELVTGLVKNLVLDIGDLLSPQGLLIGVPIITTDGDVLVTTEGSVLLASSVRSLTAARANLPIYTTDGDVLVTTDNSILLI